MCGGHHLTPHILLALRARKSTIFVDNHNGRENQKLYGRIAPSPDVSLNEKFTRSTEAKKREFIIMHIGRRPSYEKQITIR